MSTATEIDDVIGQADFHRTQLEALADRLIELHGYDPRHDNNINDELCDVIFGGADYRQALERIMDAYKPSANTPRRPK